MPKSREYCCCAIPLVNVGIYAIMVEQTVLGIIVGALSFATPSSNSIPPYMLCNSFIENYSCWFRDS